MEIAVPSVRVAMLLRNVKMHELAARLGNGMTVDRLRHILKGRVKNVPTNFVELVSTELSLDVSVVRLEVEAACAACREREAQAA